MTNETGKREWVGTVTAEYVAELRAQAAAAIVAGKPRVAEDLWKKALRCERDMDGES